jgi:hypothetical protein
VSLSRTASSAVGVLCFHSGWHGGCRIDAAAAAWIENEIVARFPLREVQKLPFRILKALNCLDPQTLAVWETSKYIEFVIHPPSRTGFHPPFWWQLAYQGARNLVLLKLLQLRGKKSRIETGP